MEKIAPFSIWSLTLASLMMQLIYFIFGYKYALYSSLTVALFLMVLLLGGLIFLGFQFGNQFVVELDINLVEILLFGLNFFIMLATSAYHLLHIL